jgi:adenylate cyclase
MRHSPLLQDSVEISHGGLHLASALDIWVMGMSWDCHNKRARNMSFEIERKFLVRDDGWRQLANRHSNIRQAHLDSSAKASVRVRIVDNNVATLTIKSRPSTLRRLELEYAIPILEAEALLPLRRGIIIEKVRYIIPVGDLAWEIDVFAKDNDGLIVAEIELPDEAHEVELPSWIGCEVTGQAQYYNGTLAQHPFSTWTEDAAVPAIERRA